MPLLAMALQYNSLVTLFIGLVTMKKHLVVFEMGFF